ncbi:hypothetical protein [Streptomyces sp. NPDC014622]|uniref:hypothetical protein n=3 Tax=unclassified Streptomyces TaxID=2593676 RepID=UPI0036F62662
MAGKRKMNPAGSTNNLRGDVLCVLGVLKVATVEQIQQISAPHMSYRHTDKDKPSERKQARTASHLGALSDLRKHGLVENGGKIPGGDTLRNLTPMGPDARSSRSRWQQPGEAGQAAAALRAVSSGQWYCAGGGLLPECAVTGCAAARPVLRGCCVGR